MTEVMNGVTRAIGIIMSTTTVDPILAEALAFFLLGARNNIRILGKPTNFYLLEVGHSSITHKSTATDKMMEPVDEVHKHSLGTVEGLKEAMLEFEYDGPEDPGNYLIIRFDEFGQFLKQSKSGYVGYKMMVDVLNSLYACKEYTFPSKKGGSLTVNGTRVNMVASITQDAFAANVSKEILEGGLLKRTLVIVPEKAPYRPPWELVDMAMPEVLDEWEPYVEERSPELTISREVKESHQRMMLAVAEKDESLYGMWQRGEMNVFKIAAINALLERNDTRINMADYNRGLRLVVHSIAMQMSFLKGGK
jgi:hypothetical protein